ncbi:uncharacterized protein LOC143199036 isoform X2 [Rhynchophorus ferrugineus]|uniref:uncharacterized protein LOC143199036 isoform X2 n=1 Tax=Rhynchophorus ferrugineus TaxID=354439 RepID=UPI003FCCCCFE
MIYHYNMLNITYIFLAASITIVKANSNANINSAGQDMNIKIKSIAKNIVNKWQSEGLVITKDKVQGWLGKLEQGQILASQETEKTKKDIEQKNVENELKKQQTLNDVKTNVVKAFSKIGKIRCENCNEGVKVEEKEKLHQTEKIIKSLSKLQMLTETVNLGKNLKEVLKVTPKDEL